MKHLTEEHVAAYIGKGLTCKLHGSRKRYTLDGIRLGKAVLIGRNGVTVYKTLHEVMLCLRPLSQLTEVIDHDGKRFVPMGMIKHGVPEDYLANHWAYNLLDGEKTIIKYVPHGLIVLLHSLHFDTEGLIEAGFAEPIPSIPQP